ncbi:14780_t:CDS:2 [Acaulospora morrowiae]|uniref:non-specific serine/threonine protein kinase n=1 Tax=Acaulospora morrowiae TaxID=94023 RepID=A0A9N9BVK7_9GLOM|nr:14780_t:CDS:2 [Acaulospora morrowiae]
MYQLLGGQTKKIKTYGRKQNERVIPATNALKAENDTVSAVNSESFNFTLNHVKNQQSKGSTLVKNIPMSKHCTSPNKTESHEEKTFEGEQRRRENALTDNSMLPDNASPEKHSVSTKENADGKTSSSAEDSRLPLTPKNPNNIQLQVKKIEPIKKLKTMVKPKLNRSLKISSPIECENDKNQSDQIYANQASCKEHEVESSSNEVKVLLIEKPQETIKPKTIEQLGANNTSVSMMITTGLTKVASLLLRNKSQESEDELTTLLKLCDQKKIYSFDEYIGVECMRSAVKIGEASFSEVFAAYAPQFTAKKVKSVFKIIPFGRGKEILINGEEQCSIRDISQEVKTTLELGGRTGLDPNLRVGFLQLYSVAICRGKYPELLLNKWDGWDAEHKSESSRPDYFDERQLYIVFVEEHGGQSLEIARLKNWAQAWSLLAQVGWSLAQVEQSLKFEHRDLHWGNITIKYTKQARISYDIASATKKVEVPTFGIKTSIIDYTLSRMERDQEIIYVDISDESYFTGQGDHQYDVYRKMREETKGDWKSFWPKTNVFWLRYLADKLLTSKSLPKPRKSNDQHPYYHAILQFEKKAEKYSSAMEAMNKDESWRI